MRERLQKNFPVRGSFAYQSPEVENCLAARGSASWLAKSPESKAKEMAPNGAVKAGSVQVAAVRGLGEGSNPQSNHTPLKLAKERISEEKLV